MNSIGVVDIADSGGRPVAVESEGLSAGAASGLEIRMQHFAAGPARTTGQSQ